MSLTTDETTFVEGVSTRTRIDPRVVVGWLVAEGSFRPGGTGGHNYLNLRPEPGDPYVAVSSGGFEQFANVQDAVTATVHRLGEPFAHGIVQGDTGRTPRQEIAAIAASSWDAGHYGGAGGPNLVAAFESAGFPPAALDDRYLDPANARAVAATAGTGSAADIGSYDAGNAAHDIKQAVTSPFAILSQIWAALGNPETWIRVGLGVAGLALIVVGAREAL